MCTQDESALREKEKIMSSAGDVFLQLQKAEQEDREALEVAQRKLQAASSGLVASEDGGEATLQDQLMSKNLMSFLLT